MSKRLVPDAPWEQIAPLLPSERPKPEGDRPWLPNRAVFPGISVVVKSDIPWEILPQEMGCGSGVTCWRRPCDWHGAGVWEHLHQVLLNRTRGGRPDHVEPGRPG